MVRHTLRILQQMLLDFESVPDHFAILQSKELKLHTYEFSLNLRNMNQLKKI